MNTVGNPPSKRDRLDKLLVKNGLVTTRQRAQAFIMEGKVRVDGKRVEKAGVRVDADAKVEIVGEDIPYVSRGGLKLEKALDYWGITVGGKTFLDVGASTGGFTDCLLQRGAVSVYAVDVGYGQLAWKLQRDERVVSLERSNIRYLTREQLGVEPDSAVIDVSFISLKKVVPRVVALIKESGDIVALIKPQFEVSKGEVGKGGVVRDHQTHERVVNEVACSAGPLGLTVNGVMESPLLGPKGNREFFIYLKKTVDAVNLKTD
jgi:23S rRNA (cytidine1920-2'-O)/16S rRNA (cytidine1409-2'-O)-methyltransferase